MPNTLKLGCSTLQFGGHLLEQSLDGIRLAGYQAVELCCVPGMAHHFWPALHKDALAILKGQIAARGLQLESIGGSGACGSLESVKQTLAAAAALGAPFVTTGAGGKSNDEESFKGVVKAYKEYAKVAADLGVRLSVKPHVSHAVYHGPSSLRFINELDTQWVGINYDPTHIFRTPTTKIRLPPSSRWPRTSSPHATGTAPGASRRSARSKNRSAARAFWICRPISPPCERCPICVM